MDKTAELKDKELGNLISIRDELQRKLGIKGEKAGSLIKRFFSPSDARTKDLFKSIKKETGIDLTKEATLSEFAMDALKDTRGRTLLKGKVPITKQGAIDTILNSIYEKIASKPEDKLTRMILNNQKIPNSMITKLADKLGLGVSATGKVLEGLSGQAKKLPGTDLGKWSEKMGKKFPIGGTIKDVSGEMKGPVEAFGIGAFPALSGLMGNNKKEEKPKESVVRQLINSNK
jgi:hypothetical protein